MLDTLTWLSQIGRHLGVRWLGHRVAQAVRTRAGFLSRRAPAARWHARPLEHFLADGRLRDPVAYLTYRSRSAPRAIHPDQTPECHRSATWPWGSDRRAIAVADAVMAGRFPYFTLTVVEAGFPPDWHRNPFTGERAPSDRHWSRIDDFTFGDIKVIWEPSRFGFAFALARAYWQKGDERYPEVFWKLVESWREANPPNVGANWKCGQETAFRVIAWCFALDAFRDAAATTAGRVASLAEMIAVSGERIAANLDHALSQRNNHGISEALGLWTIGVLFPELSSSAEWREVGRRLLEREARDLIYDDGAFAQHSFNYQRLVLHDYVWAFALADRHGERFSDELYARVERAASLLAAVLDADTGGAPHLGHDDGSLILPLDECQYWDFRPVVQAASYAASGLRPYGAGPWDEGLLWLFGPRALVAPSQPTAEDDLAAGDGGCYTLRERSGFAFARCGSFRHRPAHADLLHVDLWWRGHNVAIDAGTFSYNGAPPWQNLLGATRFHNTVTVDGCDQMIRAGRFMWLSWPDSRVRAHGRSAGGALAYWEGEHAGYERLRTPVRHRRAVARIGDETWLVLDALESDGPHDYRLHWLLADRPYVWDPDRTAVRLDTIDGVYWVRAGVGPPTMPAGGSLVRGDEREPRGWCSPGYLVRVPALSLALDVRAATAWLWTLFSPEETQVSATTSRLLIRGPGWTGRVELGDTCRSLVAREIALDAAAPDLLLTASCTRS